MNLKKIVLGTLLYFIVGYLHAQHNITASGDTFSTTSGSISYSVGQIAYSYYSTDGYSVNQGVQQPYEISSIDGNDAISLEYTAYPNPTTDFLYVTIQNYNQQKLFYAIHDMSGRTLISKEISKKNTQLTMKYFTSAMYVVLITDGSKVLKTFKVIKN